MPQHILSLPVLILIALSTCHQLISSDILLEENSSSETKRNDDENPEIKIEKMEITTEDDDEFEYLDPDLSEEELATFDEKNMNSTVSSRSKRFLQHLFKHLHHPKKRKKKQNYYIYHPPRDHHHDSDHHHKHHKHKPHHHKPKPKKPQHKHHHHHHHHFVYPMHNPTPHHSSPDMHHQPDPHHHKSDYFEFMHHHSMPQMAPPELGWYNPYEPHHHMFGGGFFR